MNITTIRRFVIANLLLANSLLCAQPSMLEQFKSLRKKLSQGLITQQEFDIQSKALKDSQAKKEKISNANKNNEIADLEPEKKFAIVEEHKSLVEQVIQKQITAIEYQKKKDVILAKLRENYGVTIEQVIASLGQPIEKGPNFIKYGDDKYILFGDDQIVRDDRFLDKRLVEKLQSYNEQKQLIIAQEPDWEVETNIAYVDAKESEDVVLSRHLKNGWEVVGRRRVQWLASFDYGYEYQLTRKIARATTVAKNIPEANWRDYVKNGLSLANLKVMFGEPAHKTPTHWEYKHFYVNFNNSTVIGFGPTIVGNKKATKPVVTNQNATTTVTSSTNYSKFPSVTVSNWDKRAAIRAALIAQYEKAGMSAKEADEHLQGMGRDPLSQSQMPDSVVDKMFDDLIAR